MKKILYIPEMNCGHCEEKIKKAINDLSGEVISVDLQAKKVEIYCSKSNEEIVDSIGDYGFDVEKIEE